MSPAKGPVIRHADRTLDDRRDDALAIATSVAAVGAGLAVRLWNVRGQVLGGDELHAVATALGRPLGWILTTYSLADYSIPLTAGIRVWLESGGALTEMGLRAPGLVCGTALVALVAVAATRAFGAACGARAAWLVALAPGLVLYSRIVRSYAPMLLFAIAAAIAAWRFLESGSRRAAAAWVACAALAIWFHLGAAPFVIAPFVFAAAERAIRTGRTTDASEPSLRAIVGAALALGLACALFLVPARASLAKLVSGVRQTELPDVETWLAIARLQSGAHDLPLVLAAVAFAGLGVVALARSRPRLAAYGATLVAVHVAGLLVLRPTLFEHSFILNRYLLPCLVVWLVAIAIGLGALAPRRPAVGALATIALVAALAARGPLAAIPFQRGSFAHANDAVSFEDGVRLGVDASRAPRFYRELAANPPPAIVEIPWHAWWQFSRLFAADQRLHGVRVVVAGEVPGLDDPRIAFRSFVWPDPERLAATGASWVVVHTDLEAEQSRIVGLPRDDTFGEVPAATRALAWDHLRRTAASAAAQLEASWGPADVVEKGLRAWRLPRP